MIAVILTLLALVPIVTFMVLLLPKWIEQGAIKEASRRMMITDSHDVHHISHGAVVHSQFCGCGLGHRLLITNYDFTRFRKECERSIE